jgi:hypothetical protein
LFDTLISLLRSFSPYGNLLTDRFENSQIYLFVLTGSGIIILVRMMGNFLEKKKLEIHLSKFKEILAIGITAIMVINGREYETQFRHPPETLALYQVQTWAKANTLPGELFLGYAWSSRLGWRTLSHRAIAALSDCGSSPYFYSKSDQYCDKLSQVMKTKYDSPEEKLIHESQLTGADYVLRKIGETRLDFKVVYANAEYIVYAIPKN